jgi:hypothetical protein
VELLGKLSDLLLEVWPGGVVASPILTILLLIGESIISSDWPPFIEGLVNREFHFGKLLFPGWVSRIGRSSFLLLLFLVVVISKFLSLIFIILTNCIELVISTPTRYLQAMKKLDE